MYWTLCNIYSQDIMGHLMRTTVEAVQFVAHTGDFRGARKKFASNKLPKTLKPMASLRFPVRLEHH